MYPFERFTDEAKRTLTLAQEEAETTRHSYIGTEHLLVALIANTDGIAHRVLTGLGLEIEKLREEVGAVLERDEHAVIQQIIPTSRVKKVIEISFEEARRTGSNHVGTEHLLLGLLIEAEGIAARVLEDLGASLDRVRAETERIRATGATEHHQRTGPPGGPTRPRPQVPGPANLPELGPDARDLLRLASAIASAEAASAVGLEHVIRALDDPAVRSLLQAAATFRQAVAAREEATAAGDFGAARSRREEEQRLREEYAQAEARWRRQLG
ncbi:MAG TPA: Clp protease N-terminal domain-containing protein [Candidatus Dormibacteraeota bacterium]|nr:Clp protease N-terminal domain-containing protein [Candidatus Dormibacteraeota bacterium]